MKIIAITNEKGGVGKTTISTHLGHSLVKDGHKVAFVDSNAQGNSTRFLKPYLNNVTAYDFFNYPIDDIDIDIDDFILLGATRKLLSITSIDRNIISNNVKFLISCGYDYLIFDTSPEMSKCALSCLVVSDFAFSPVNMSNFAFDGVANTLDIIRQVREKTDSNINFAGLIPNLVNTKSKVHMTSLKNLFLSQPGNILPFLASRSPYTDVMNDTIPLWDMKPMAGNIKVANHELSRLLDSMKTLINAKETANAS